MLSRFHRLAAAGLAPALFALISASAATPARAVTVFDVNVLNATAAAGGTGSFDVTITNNSTSDAVNLGGFQLRLSVASNSGVEFTDATTSTTAATYVFAGNSSVDSSSPFVSTSTVLPGGAVQVSDLYAGAAGYQSIGAGATLGLGHFTFSVAAGTAAGPITVSVDPFSNGSGTQFSDVTGNNFFTYSPTNGTITVTANAVPEPSSMVLAGTALGIGLMGLRRKKAARQG